MSKKNPARRRSNRWSSFGAAYAFFEHGDYVECIIKRLSSEGADFTCDAPSDVPDEVSMWIPGERIRAPARVVWRGRDSFGVQFVDEDIVQMLLERSRDTGKGDARLDRYLKDICRNSGNPADRRQALDRSGTEADSPAVNGLVAELDDVFSAMNGDATVIFEKKRELGGRSPDADDSGDGRGEVNYSIDDIVASLRSVMMSYQEFKSESCQEVRVLKKVLRDLSLIQYPSGPSADDASWFGRRAPANRMAQG